MDILAWRLRPIKRWEPGWNTMDTPSLDHAARFACAGKKILTTRSPRSSFRSRKWHERACGMGSQATGRKEGSHLGRNGNIREALYCCLLHPTAAKALSNRSANHRTRRKHVS